MTRVCVLSGDLVDSSALSADQVDTALQSLDSAAGDISQWSPDLVTGFARSGGDGWQFSISDHYLALRSALYLRAALRRLGKAFSTRIALACGDGHLPDNRDPNAASGPAFTASGRLLASLRGPHITMGHASGGTVNALILLADHISQGWTPAQARAIFTMLPPDSTTHADAAARLGISRQAVDQALTAAGYHWISAAIQSDEDHYSSVNRTPEQR
ncbi:MAG: MarR family transcriptional regulator [Pseudomonadota bacterium]|uniref:MarR family transcriptional regulator n=1 Tax=Roseovarius TaxID=74030 RepID=UPI0022A8364A|nr:MarR family transcriptional regulator [Roseovarius sp. EGI FJ00037]MCZ0813942.1 MarR family transcriptional regulator [Roseovarius sp. EGI FJ00037]